MPSPSSTPPPVDRATSNGRAPDRPPVPRPGSPLTGRAAVLAVVLGALVLSMALPVREYVRQRSEIAALEQEMVDRQGRVADLERRLEQWEDPAYVAAQARQRLQYVMPGEVGYVVLDPAEAPAPKESSSAPSEGPVPWYSTLWGSVEAADDAAVDESVPSGGPAPAPKDSPSSSPRPGSPATKSPAP